MRMIVTSAMHLLPELFLIVACGMFTAQAQVQESQDGALYLLTANPTPVENVRYPASLYKLGPSEELVLVREVVPVNEGVDSVQISFERRIISVASPNTNPHNFHIVWMDEPAQQGSRAIDHDGSGFNEHLIDIPGRGLFQSITNVFSSPEPRATQQGIGLPLAAVRPREIPDSRDQSDRTRMLGIDLSPTARTEAVELSPYDYKFLSYAGRPGGGVGSIANPAAEVPEDGKTLNMAALGSLFSIGIDLPPSAHASPGDLVVYHVINSSIVVLSIKPKGDRSDTASGTVLHVYERSQRMWSDVPIEGNATMIRAFGTWIAGAVAEDNSRTPERLSAGQSAKRRPAGKTGDSPDIRFKIIGRYFPGRLFLYDVVASQRYIIETGEGDSEVLLISGGAVYYRVNDSVYMAHLVGGQLQKPTLLYSGEAVRDAHWAFLAP